MFDVQINDRGQITIPKELRDIAKLNPQETLKIDIDNNGRLILYKKDILDELEDLIKKDLLKEGFSQDDFKDLIPQRKKELAKALLKISDNSTKEIKDNDYTTLEDFKEELKDEGLL